MLCSYLLPLLAFALPAYACEGCGALEEDIVMTRLRPRMQPEALNAVSLPRSQLEWGQINFLHTTDTHGWLEGHLKEQVRNYGADWGDFVSFTKHMKQTAKNAGVDLLLVDTGDLHDGNGLSDATEASGGVDGSVSNPVFENIDYDLLTIGNHELYLTDISYQTVNTFAKVWGNRYLTSNVQIINPSTGNYEFIGHKYRYFTTDMGLRIMAFGFLYNFGGNSNVSKIITAAESVNATWFKNAVNFDKPIDLFVVIGHNPVRPTVSGSTFGTIFNAIRTMRPEVPIQIFGGHTHVRDFVVYDDKSTGLESGRYCETLGWLAMNGLPYLNISGPEGLPHPTQAAKTTSISISSSPIPTTASPVSTGTTSTSATTTHSATASASGPSDLRYARRYLDWNRLTFEFHANGSQVNYTTKSTTQTASPTPYGSSSSTKAASPTPYGSTSSTMVASPTPYGSTSSTKTKSTKVKSSKSAASPTPYGTTSSTTVASPTPYETTSSTKTKSTKVKSSKSAVTPTSYPTYGAKMARQDIDLTQKQYEIFDTNKGVKVTEQIHDDRVALNLSALYGCAPQSWCQSCAPFLSSGNIYSLLSVALAKTVVQSARSEMARLVIVNTGSVRFDLYKGPFTYDDSFIVSPFTDTFQYIPDVPYNYASQVLGYLNAPGHSSRKRDLDLSFDFNAMALVDRDLCTDPPLAHSHGSMSKRDAPKGRIIRRQSTNTTTPGYTTTDDFGTDGDDTIHSKIAYYSQPNYFQANASLPATGNASTVDLVFLDYIAGYVLAGLAYVGATNYTTADVEQYLPVSFTTQSYLPAYAKVAADWQADVPNCPVV